MSFRFLKKSTKFEHLPSQNLTIGMGTLAHFRKLQDPEIGDPQESKIRNHFDLVPGFYNNNFLSVMTRNSIHFGGSSLEKRFPLNFYNEAMSIDNSQGQRPGKQYVVKNKGWIDYLGSDALIFCTSMISEKNFTPELGYSDSWLIGRGGVKRLSRAIEKRLNLLGPEWRASIAVNSNDIEKYRDASFRVVFGPVEYQFPTEWFDGSTLTDQKRMLLRLRKPDFIKDPRYSHQCEYRFAARLMSGREVLPLSIGYHVLTIPELAQIAIEG